MVQQFKRMDVDKSGTLDEDEVAHGANELGISEMQARTLFKDAARGSVGSGSQVALSAAGSQRSKQSPASCGGISRISGESKESRLRRTAEERRLFKPVLTLRQWVDIDRKMPGGQLLPR